MDKIYLDPESQEIYENEEYEEEKYIINGTSRLHCKSVVKLIFLLLLLLQG